ncbi:hypothetical protein [Anaeromonas frigoriresistens]|nr:hypothetical protein [Anaeromonas frigoriresistens]
MYRILSKNQMVLIGNINDICDLLTDYSFKYTTLKELIDSLNK